MLLYNPTGSLYLWAITPFARLENAERTWDSDNNWCYHDYNTIVSTIWSSLYLNSSVKITSSNGTEESPYKLSI